MPTPAERNALLFFGLVAALGGGVRYVRWETGRPPVAAADSAALAAQLAAVDSARARRDRDGRGAGERRGGGRRPRRRTPQDTAPAPPTLPVDLDRASIEEIDRLPRIGPVLAARIVADRDSLGPFGSLEALERVRGIGPAMAKRLAPHVTFSLTPRPSSAVSDRHIRPGTRPRRRAGRS